MTHGGKREGAGRKSGTPNKANAQREAEVKASGLTPLDYLLQIMRDEERNPADRIDAAKAAAPYVHPKLASVVHTGKDGGPIETDNTHHGEVAIRPFAEFLGDAIGQGAADIPG